MVMKCVDGLPEKPIKHTHLSWCPKCWRRKLTNTKFTKTGKRYEHYKSKSKTNRQIDRQRNRQTHRQTCA